MFVHKTPGFPLGTAPWNRGNANTILAESQTIIGGAGASNKNDAGFRRRNFGFEKFVLFAAHLVLLNRLT
jgi:hypothetical protein